MTTVEDMAARLGELVKSTRQIAEAVIRMEIKLEVVEAAQKQLSRDINGNGGDGLKIRMDRLEQREAVHVASASGKWAAIAQAVATVGVGVAAAVALLR